jgi:hypothetical protein
MRGADSGEAGSLPPRIALMASYLLLVLLVFLNRRVPGMALVGAGLLLNFAVMLANGGYMPITPEALEKAGLVHLATTGQIGSRVLNAKDVLLPAAGTRLWVLSDILVLPPPVGTAFSVGDVLLAFGGVGFFSRTMCDPPPRALSLGPLAAADQGR